MPEKQLQKANTDAWKDVQMYVRNRPAFEEKKQT